MSSLMSRRRAVISLWSTEASSSRRRPWRLTPGKVPEPTAARVPASPCRTCRPPPASACPPGVPGQMSSPPWPFSCSPLFLPRFSSYPPPSPSLFIFLLLLLLLPGPSPPPPPPSPHLPRSELSEQFPKDLHVKPGHLAGQSLQLPRLYLEIPLDGDHLLRTQPCPSWRKSPVNIAWTHDSTTNP